MPRFKRSNHPDNILYFVLCILTFLPVFRQIPLEFELMLLLAVLFVLNAGAIGLVWRACNNLKKLNSYLVYIPIGTYFLAYIAINFPNDPHDKDAMFSQGFAPLFLIYPAFFLWVLSFGVKEFYGYFNNKQMDD